MSSTLVDSNVLIDLYDEDSEWREWSDAMLTRCAARGPLVNLSLEAASRLRSFTLLREGYLRLHGASSSAPPESRPIGRLCIGTDRPALASNARAR